MLSGIVDNMDVSAFAVTLIEMLQVTPIELIHLYGLGGNFLIKLRKWVNALDLL